MHARAVEDFHEWDLARSLFHYDRGEGVSSENDGEKKSSKEFETHRDLGLADNGVVVFSPESRQLFSAPRISPKIFKREEALRNEAK